MIFWLLSYTTMASDDAFYTDNNAALRNASEVKTLERSCLLEEYYEIDRCIDWLNTHTKVQRVALQFPDECLPDSVGVLAALQLRCPALSYFILADTSYGSCCVDFIAAQHYNAEVVIHYGPSCASPVSRLPVLWVFGRSPIDISDCCSQLTQLLTSSHRLADRQLVLMCAVEYDYAEEQVYNQLKASLPRLTISHLCTAPESYNDHDLSGQRVQINGRVWRVAGENADTVDTCDVVFVGGESRALSSLMMCMNKSAFFSYDPATRSARKETLAVNKQLMKRYYMVERAKDARIIGIVMSTMSVANHTAIHDQLKTLISAAGKKSYTIIVGKINPAKLANFMEVDVYVLVSCSENSLIDSAEFYQPIITPFEMELACNQERVWTGEYTTDYQALLEGGRLYRPVSDNMEPSTDVSLISGGLRRVGVYEETSDEMSSQVAVRDTNRALVPAPAQSAGEYLSHRSWRGLEQKLGESEVEAATPGRIGIAVGYESEGRDARTDAQ